MLVLQDQKRELMEKAFGGMRLQTPEERRTFALRDIATLLGINLRQEQNAPHNGNGAAASAPAGVDGGNANGGHSNNAVVAPS